MLDERSRRILFAVIQSYINSPGPVGSRFIKKRYSFDFSPATIRNIMADLEEMGFLFQPHTSAGRVPTDTGYRLFVDSLAEETAGSLDDALNREMARQLETMRRDVNAFLDTASRMLSEFTRYIGITVTPGAETSTLRRIDLLPFRKNRIAVVLFTDEGVIRHKIVPVEHDFTPQELKRIADYLNGRFSGERLDDIRKMVIGEMTRERDHCDYLIREAGRVCGEILSSVAGTVYVSGLADVLRLPDFCDMDRIRDLLKTIEDKNLIVRLLDTIADAEGAQVFIGSENALDEMKTFSLVAAAYREGGRPVGAIGIIGPTRMDYRQAIAIVNTTARYITEALSYRD